MANLDKKEKTGPASIAGLQLYIFDQKITMQNIGILGGGQLGRMLLQAAANYPVTVHILENDPDCPSAHLCHQFTLGDIRDFEAVYNFGKNLDAITIEIENVNVEALEKLESEGVKVYPVPGCIKDHQEQNSSERIL
jgi:5-(carboxyamino)imidazole ribonucleotide synthase